MIALLKTKSTVARIISESHLKGWWGGSLWLKPMATSVFRRRFFARLGDLEEFLPRGCFEPTVVGQFHGWHLEKTTVFFYGGFGSVRFLPDQVDRMRQMTSFYTFFAGIHKIPRWFCLMGKFRPPFTLASSKMHSTSVKEQLSPLACQMVGTNRTDSSNNGVVKLWNSSFLQRNWYGYFRLIRARKERFDLRYDSGVWFGGMIRGMIRGYDSRRRKPSYQHWLGIEPWA